jgi:hypothetical protein
MTIERKVEADKADKPLSLSVTVNSPEFVPDTDHIYLLRYEQSNLSTDKVKIETNERGLINGVTTTSKDPIPAGIRELANFVIGVATSGITAAPPFAAFPGPAVDSGPFKVEARFDPARAKNGGDDETLTQLRGYLAQFGVEINVRRPPMLGPSTDEKIATGCEEMVCYRFVLPYRLVVTDPISRGQAEAIVMLPNEGPIAGVRVVRRSFVENKFTLVFTNGVLTSADYDDPSALIGALMIPIDIAKAIVSIPSALFRFTIAHEQADLTAEKDVIEAQKALAQAQIDLLQKEQELEALQSAEQSRE